MKIIMKFKTLILAAMIIALGSPAIAQMEPAIYLVRHAEKLADTDPGLTEKGVARAQALADLMAHANLKAVYSTPYKRTMMTALPSAENAGLEVTEYDPRALQAFADKLKADFLASGESILVVGHSNTTPVLANFLTGASHRMLNEDEYSHLFVVRSDEGGMTYKIQYFEPNDEK